MNKVAVFLLALFVGFSFPLMAKDHEGRGHQGSGHHQEVYKHHGKHRGHPKHRDKYYHEEYWQHYHHGRHRHYHRDHHGHYVPVYIVGYHEHICDVDHGYYNDNGNFIELNVDSRGNANLRLNVDLDHH